MDTNLIATNAGDQGWAAEVRVFQSGNAPADPEGITALEAGIQGADLAAPAVVLPDFHHKSNMEMPLKGFAGNASVKNSEAEIQGANQPRLRLLRIRKKTSTYPLSDYQNTWTACTPISSQGRRCGPST